MKLGNRKHMTCAARFTLLAAAAIAVYLGFVSWGAPVAGCSDSSSCATLLKGGWSKAFGIPVAFLGAGAYLALALLAATVVRGEAKGAAIPGLVLMVLIPTVAVWFVGVQAVALKAFCPWCCLTHGLAVLGVAALIFARHAGRREKGAPRADLRKAFAVVPTASILLFVAFVAAVSSSPGERAGVAKAKLDSPLKRSVLSPADPRGDDAIVHVGPALELHGGEISIWPEELPTLGNAKAEHLVVLLGDFTCEHCRALHAMLDQVVEVYGDQLGVAILPAVRGDESALIQRVALALHRENPDLYRALAASVGSGEIAAEASAVTAEATRLMGAERLSVAMREHRRWIDAQLAAAAAVRDANAKSGGRRTLPQLMAADEVIFGAHPSPGYYVDLLQTKFPLRQVATVENVVGTGSADDRPKLELESRKLLIGELANGEVVQAYIPFENTGEGPLVLNWIKTSPGVSVASFPSGELEPGAKGMIALDVRGPEQAGAFRQPIVIHSNAHLEGTAVHLVGLVAPAGVRQANAADGEPE